MMDALVRPRGAAARAVQQARKRGRGWLAALAALGLFSVAAPEDARAEGRDFTERERATLLRGGLVVRRKTQRRGDLQLIGGTSFQVIDRPPEQVWRAIRDTGHYPSFVPELVEARVAQNDEDERVLLFRHRQGPVEASYFVTQREDSAHRTLHFRVDRTRPGDLSEGWGFIRIAPYASDKSIVTFGIFADIGHGILAGFVRPSVHEWILRVPELLNRYLQGSGRDRYQAAR